MVMEDPHRVREEVTPRLHAASLILGRQFDILDELRPRIQACAQPSPAQLASHRAHEQGDARLLRGIIAVLTDSIPQLEVAAGLLSSALKQVLDSGATRHALPFLGHDQSEDQIKDHLLAIPRTTRASFHPNGFPVSIHIALSSLRLAIDYYLDRCLYILRRLGMPGRIALVHDPGHAKDEAQAYLEWAPVLLSRAYGHNFDAIYGHLF